MTDTYGDCRTEEGITTGLIDAVISKWVTSDGWRTVHIQRGEDHPVRLPNGRWTVCGRLVRVPLPRLWHDELECGQCLRRAAALRDGGTE